LYTWWEKSKLKSSSNVIATVSEIGLPSVLSIKWAHEYS